MDDFLGIDPHAFRRRAAALNALATNSEEDAIGLENEAADHRKSAEAYRQQADDLIAHAMELEPQAGLANPAKTEDGE